MAETQIKDLPNAGTPTVGMHFAVQQESADDIAQEITLDEFSEDSAMAAGDATVTNKLVTPKAFFTTNATTSANGTILTATAAKVAAKTATDSALTPSNIDDVGTVLFIPAIIDSSRIDAVKYPASSTIANFTMYEILVGRKKTINGFLDFTVATASTDYLEFTLNTTSSPTISQSGNGSWYDTSLSGNPRHPAGVTVITGGTNIVKIRVGVQFGGSFINGKTYRLHVGAEYITV